MNFSFWWIQYYSVLFNICEDPPTLVMKNYFRWFFLHSGTKTVANVVSSLLRPSIEKYAQDIQQLDMLVITLLSDVVYRFFFLLPQKKTISLKKYWWHSLTYFVQKLWEHTSFKNQLNSKTALKVVTLSFL